MKSDCKCVNIIIDEERLKEFISCEIRLRALVDAGITKQGFYEYAISDYIKRYNSENGIGFDYISEVVNHEFDKFKELNRIK